MKYLALAVLPTVFMISCLGTTPQQPQAPLISLSESELSRSVYEVIANDIAPTNANKNAIIEGVKAAIDALPRTKDARDKAITAATAANGGPYPILTAKIIAQVDIENPILSSLPPSTKVTSPTESQLSKAVYDAIDAAILPNESKNKIMADVRAALDPRPATLTDRTLALVQAVGDTGTLKLATAIIAQVDAEDPILMTEDESRLHWSIYKVIDGAALDADDKLDTTKKNKVMTGVKAAIALLATQTERKAAITKAVADNGDLAGLAEEIIEKVDAAEPLLMTQAESKLPETIHKVIREAVLKAASEKQHKIWKNNIMAGVLAAIDVRPEVQGDRNNAIDNAVAANGGAGLVALMDAIIAQVNAAYPILTTQPDSGLSQSIYDVIANSALDNTQKNDIMVAIIHAMAAPKIQIDRDAAITKAVVADNNGPAKLASDIIAEVNLEDPILVLQPVSGLPEDIYDVIANSALDIATKNKIMAAVKAAMDANPDEGVVRNVAIIKAIMDNGGSDDLANSVEDLLPVGGGLFD